MEARSQSPASGRPDAPPGRSTPAQTGPSKVQRIGSQTRGLFEDFKSWVELRLRLFQLDVQEKIQEKVDEAIIKIAPVVVGLLAGFFLLITTALFIGWALGHPAWGFLVVTGLLLTVTALLYVRSRRLGRDDREIDVTPTNGARSSGGGSQ